MLRWRPPPLFAVAAHRGVELAAAFVISDSLSDLVWEPHFLSTMTLDALIGVYGAAVRVLDRTRL